MENGRTMTLSQDDKSSSSLFIVTPQG